MRTVALAGLVLAWGCGARHEATDANSGDRIEPDQIVELIDHPERFKGKTVTVLVRVDSHIHARDGDSLQKYAGRDVRFRAFGPGGSARLDLTVRMPADGLPNAKMDDELLVTFLCKEGRTASGNEGIRVERPRRD